MDGFYDRIMRCRVVVAAPHLHRNDGILYNVHIDITVPGAEVVVKREPNEDLLVAVRDAFDAARRKLEDFARWQRGEVKRREDVSVAQISRLFPDQGYGFITTPDGREIYFHENSLINHDFKDLRTGMTVRFAEENGEKGPQASTVTVTGR